MQKQPPTYHNDNDVSELVYTEVTDEKLLNFFFKKGGKVNVNNLSYVVHEYGKKELAQHFVNLETAGLIEYIEWPMAKVTTKARWERLRDNKTLWFIIGLLSLAAAFLALR